MALKPWKVINLLNLQKVLIFYVAKYFEQKSNDSNSVIIAKLDQFSWRRLQPQIIV